MQMTLNSNKDGLDRDSQTVSMQRSDQEVRCNDIITGSGHYSPLPCMVTNLGMEFISPGATKWNIYISDTLLLTWEWVLAALIRINWRGIWVGEGKHCANKQIIYGPLLSSSFEYVQCK